MDTGTFLEIFPDFFLIIMGLMRRMGLMGRMRKSVVEKNGAAMP